MTKTEEEINMSMDEMVFALSLVKEYSENIKTGNYEEANRIKAEVLKYFQG